MDLVKKEDEDEAQDENPSADIDANKPQAQDEKNKLEEGKDSDQAGDVSGNEKDSNPLDKNDEEDAGLKSNDDAMDENVVNKSSTPPAENKINEDDNINPESATGNDVAENDKENEKSAPSHTSAAEKVQEEDKAEMEAGKKDDDDVQKAASKVETVEVHNEISETASSPEEGKENESQTQKDADTVEENKEVEGNKDDNAETETNKDTTEKSPPSTPEKGEEHEAESQHNANTAEETKGDSVLTSSQNKTERSVGDSAAINEVEAIEGSKEGEKAAPPSTPAEAGTNAKDTDGEKKKETASLPSSLKNARLPPLPPQLRGMRELEASVISPECQKFLLELDIFTANQFLASDIQLLSDKYLEFRHARESTITPVSARVYINKYRKRVRDSLADYGIQWFGLLEKEQDFIVASSERVIKAENELLTLAQNKILTSSSQKPTTQQNLLGQRPNQLTPLMPRPAQHLSTQAPPQNKIKLVYLILSEAGTFGLKVENTANNGVRITDTLAGLQGERAGFKKGDVIATAVTNFALKDPPVSKLMEQNMTFDEFVQVAQNPIRPVKVWIRRKPQDVYERDPESLSKMFQRKRGRPRKDEDLLKANKSRKRIKPAERNLQQFRVQKLRAMRLEIIRAHGLREAADAFDKSMVKALANCPVAMQKAKDMAQLMREESSEIWNNASHGDWEYFLKAMLDFKRVHGNVNIPTTHPDKQLLRFISGVRGNYRAFRKGEFKKSRKRNEVALEIEIFNSIGFKWGPLVKREDWEKSFKQLCEYKEKYGSVIIPKEKRKGRYSGLHGWILQQRRNFINQQKNLADSRRSARLSDDQIIRLNDIGFAWTVDDERTWDSYFEDLLQYKLKHGHCNVPSTFSANKPLCRWVGRMRELKKERDEGKESDVLTKDRYEMLNYFGFDWNGKENKK